MNTLLRQVLDVTRQRRARMLQQFTCKCGKHGVMPHRDAAVKGTLCLGMVTASTRCASDVVFPWW